MYIEGWGLYLEEPGCQKNDHMITFSLTGCVIVSLLATALDSTTPRTAHPPPSLHPSPRSPICQAM